MWTVKVSNTSNGVVTHLGVSVTAVDAHGNEIPGGCRQANDQMVIGDAFRRLISDALGGAVTGALGASPWACSVAGGQDKCRSAPQRHRPTARAGSVGAIPRRHARPLVREWMTTLMPGQFAVMAFQNTDPSARLRVVLEFEDEAGYRWRRPDDGQPVQMKETAKLAERRRVV
jgi:hypothetical protein